jgi:glycosyltransferase involved in cell wall biosynthesis
MLYWRVQYDALRRARAVFFTTEQEKRLAGESFRPNRWNGVVVPYGITDPQISEQETGRWVEAFYAKFPLLRGRRYLLFMSRIHEKKGCDLLIEAFAKYAERYPDLDLVIAGPDQVGMRAKLEKRAERLKIAQRIHWPGMISGSLKWGALHACEAMVLPSHQENFGIVVVESLAMGRPVLISNQVNIWSEIEASRVGMVDDDTPEGVERLLGRWTAMSTTERAGMAAGARAAFHKNYAMDRTATLIRDMFLEKDVRG